MAQVMTIRPYRWQGMWVFDDPATGLEKEPFVCGIPEMIDELVADIPRADRGFVLTFSSEPFDGWQRRVKRVRPEGGGTVYREDEPKPARGQAAKEGWLCPALFKYFQAAPEYLYVRADEG